MKKKETINSWFKHLKKQIQGARTTKDLKILSGRADAACFAGNITISELLELKDELKSREKRYGRYR